MRADIDPAVVDRVDPFAHRARDLPGGVGRGVGGLGVDEVDDGLGLGQVQLAVEKGPLGEFTGPGQACPGRAQGV